MLRVFMNPLCHKSGFIEAKDRNGNMSRFPLMTVSAVLLKIQGNRSSNYSSEEVSNVIAKLKPAAKSREDKLCIACIENCTDAFRELAN